MTDEKNESLTNMAQGWTDFVERMTRLNSETMMLGVRGMQPWVDAYSRLFTAATPAVPATPAAGCGCRIPETECPPYCACTLEWTLQAGDVRVGHIQIKNTSKETISYSLAAGPFQACGDMTKSTPRLEPESGRVAPGESMHVRVTVTTDKSWRPGETYESEMKIRGKYERCVCLRVEMACEPEACCRFEMGEIPTRVRADAWTKHFQCTELCFEPIPIRTPNEQPQNPPAPTHPGQPTHNPS